MKIKIYRKIIRPIIRYAHDEYPPTVDENWYDDNEMPDKVSYVEILTGKIKNEK